MIALFGFATALYGTIRLTILTDVYSKHHGTAVALTLAVGVTSWYSWRAGWSSS